MTADSAKEIAPVHAGLAEANVTFFTVKPDADDGRPEYEIEFYSVTLNMIMILMHLRENFKLRL